MTKLVYIQGPAKAKRPPANEFRDRSKEVPKPKFIDYTAMTDGEMKIALLNEQVDILKGFYPEVKAYQEASQVLDAALKDGLHNISYIPGNAATFVRGEIAMAIRQTNPAAGMIQRRKDMLKGLGGLVPVPDCGPNPQIDAEWYSQYGWLPNANDVKAYEACQKENFYRNLLNRNLEGSSHHLLYAYEANPNGRPAIVAAKKIFHDLAIDKFQSVTSLGLDNLRLWIRNGIMRNNAANGTEPFQPESTIEALSELIPQEEGIGVFPIAALLPILSAIFAAISATVAFIESFKKEDQLKIQGTVQNIGLPSFGPQKTDWYVTGGNTPGGTPGSAQNSNSNMLPILLLGAGAFLLTQSKK